MRSSVSTELERSAEYALVHDLRDGGRRALTRGTILLVTLPVVAIFAMVSGTSIALWLLAGVYSIVAGAAGVVMTGMGWSRCAPRPSGWQRWIATGCPKRACFASTCR